MASSAHKKVLVVRFERESVQGFAQIPTSFGESGLELLTPSGNLLQVPYSETKLVCFVKEFDLPQSWQDHRKFLTRPKNPGLWVKFVFSDHDSLEALLPNDLMQVGAAGFWVLPPDPSFQNQRLFLPKASLSEAHVLGVVGAAPKRAKSVRQPAKADPQLEMFP